jgi:formylglycine-generating enzyme required for sulfatase activity
MVVVPAGSFLMGSPEDEAARSDNEGPQHRVTIAEPFAIGVYEVTFDEWDACVADGGCNGYRPDDADWGRGRRPVIYVSWDDAQAYVDWLSNRTREEYRLPSEAEWEYAARAGTTTRYWSGDEVVAVYANFDRNVGRTIEVGSLARPNAFGLHDVHGNVWEWIEDCWNGSYVGAPANGSAWTSGNCDWRVLRGGSWLVNPWLLRSAYRDWFVPVVRFNFTGFRVARTLR